MHRVLLTSVGAVAIAVATGSALAADLPRAAPMPYKAPAYVAPIYNWTGFYLGGHLGYGWANTAGTVTVGGNAFFNGTASGSGNKLDGFLGGGQVGYNWQTGQFVFGVEADLTASDQTHSAAAACGVGCSITENERVRWFGTVRGRVGYAADRFLFYVTGGVAWQDFDSHATFTTPGGSTSFSTNHSSRAGWVIGGGVEAALWGNWTGGLEYLYVDTDVGNSGSYAIPPVAGGGTATVTHRLENNVVRAKINYRF